MQGKVKLFRTNEHLVFKQDKYSSTFCYLPEFNLFCSSRKILQIYSNQCSITKCLHIPGCSNNTWVINKASNINAVNTTPDLHSFRTIPNLAARQMWLPGMAHASSSWWGLITFNPPIKTRCPQSSFKHVAYNMIFVIWCICNHYSFCFTLNIIEPADIVYTKLEHDLDFS